MEAYLRAECAENRGKEPRLIAAKAAANRELLAYVASRVAGLHRANAGKRVAAHRIFSSSVQLPAPSLFLPAPFTVHRRRCAVSQAPLHAQAAVLAFLAGPLQPHPRIHPRASWDIRAARPVALAANMSDYGDDFEDDYGDDWLYVEDEYMQADDLAEHAVASPPPIAYDDDRLDEWDRFDYFNDLEYDSEGYDDANFVTHNGATGQPKIGQKRKRGAVAGRGSKKQRLTKGDGKPEQDVVWLSNSPIIWRAQADRGVKARPLPDDAEPYAILKDWRTLAKAPNRAQKPTKRELAALPPKAHMDEDEDWEDDELADEGNDDGDEAGMEGIDPAALMAALQSRLGSAGGPLSGMDPQQLLQFALRMANNQDAGDDIAGELADEMLNQGEQDEDEEEAEANLMSWVSQQRDGSNTDIPKGDAAGVAATSTPETSVSQNTQKPQSAQADQKTDPTDEAVADDSLEVKQKPHNLEIKQTSRKRKAHSAADSPSASPKKRATKPPTPAPPAKPTPAKSARSGRVRR